MTDSTIAPAANWPSLRTRPDGLKARLAAPAVRILVRRLSRRLGFTLSEGGGRPAGLVLREPDEFYTRVGADGLIGLGEAYMTGAWDSDDLGDLLTLLCRHLDEVMPASVQALRGVYLRRRPVAERNTRDGAQHNIAHHYDLSNDLFASFLDESMSYSAGLFDDGGVLPPAASLHEAQLRKIERILDQARVGPGSRVLDIGTGWGELAIQAARRGATVRTITLSHEQCAYVRRRVADEGLSSRVEADVRDYRDVDPELGCYDAVVSVEMVEAVGREYLATYFGRIEALLTPGGRAVIQAITMPHDRMLATHETWTWITKYIFPGGFLPSLRLLNEIVDAHTSLRPVESFPFGADYAETLRHWDERFLSSRDAVLALGFDETFIRMWHFYLQYARAGFASGYLDVSQLTWERP